MLSGAAFLLLFATLATAQLPDPEQTAACAKWLAEQQTTPADYLVTAVQRHDCVLLGETHHVRENCAFVAASLSPLYERAGLRVFATEFLRQRQTAAMQLLVTAAEYDEAKVVGLLRDGPWPTWGFADYADIFRAVWQLNRSLPAGAPPLRVLGLDSDWSQYDFWFGGLSPRQVFQLQYDREVAMTEALAKGPLAHGDKTLVHCGFAHSVTCHGERLGTVLRRRFGDRVFQVALHQEFPGRNGKAPLSVWLDATLQRGKPIGFDLQGSPLAGLRDPACVFWTLLPKATLADFAEGYVYLAPLDRLRRARWIPGFVTDANFPKTVAVAEKLGYVPKGQCQDAAALDAALQQRFPADEVQK